MNLSLQLYSCESPCVSLNLPICKVRCLDKAKASLVAQSVRNLPAMWETQVRSMVWEDSPGEGIGNPLQYSCLENSMDRGAWWAI